MRLRISFKGAGRVRYQNRVVLNTLSKVERFLNDTVSRSCKRRNRIDLKRSGTKLAGSRSKYGKSRTECSALLHNHNFDLWFNFAFTAFMYFTINRGPYRNKRQRCLEMLTFSSIRPCRVTKRKAKRRFCIRPGRT